MDCEKCEDLLLDELYGELDDVTSALVRRHVAGCSRCNAILSDFKGTRDLVSSFPVVTPPTSLEERIFAAEKEARKVVPIRSRALAFVSVAGRWAMRPQTAMAALFLLMIGSTTFLLKGRAGSHASAPVTVAQEGAPMAAAPAGKMETLAPNAARGAHGPLEQQQAQGTPPPAASAAANVVAAMDESPMKEPRDLELAKGMSASDKPSAPARTTAHDPNAEDDRITNASAPAGAPAPAPTMAPMTAGVANAGPVAAQYGGDSKALGGASGGGAGFYSQQPGNVNGNGNGNAKKDGDDDFSQGMAAYQSRQYPTATQSFDRAGGRGDLNASLYAARSVRDGQGCVAAITRFDAVAARGGTSFVGADALFDGAQCNAQTGNVDTARAKYTQLLGVASHAQRAQQALDSLNQVAARRSAPKAAAKAPAAAAAPPPATPPAQAAPQQAPPSKAAADTGL
jgi:hypothetical protein